MLTLEGLATGQVLQRAFAGGPPAAVSAACDRAGELWMRVTAADGLLEGFERRVLRRIDAGRHACELPELPPAARTTSPWAWTLPRRMATTRSSTRTTGRSPRSGRFAWRIPPDPR